jgi:hypothetical protein
MINFFFLLFINKLKITNKSLNHQTKNYFRKATTKIKNLHIFLHSTLSHRKGVQNRLIKGA